MSLTNTQWSWLGMFRGSHFSERKNSLWRKAFINTLYTVSAWEEFLYNQLSADCRPLWGEGIESHFYSSFCQGTWPSGLGGSVQSPGLQWKVFWGAHSEWDNALPQLLFLTLPSCPQPNPNHAWDNGTFLECAWESKWGCLPCCWLHCTSQKPLS